MWGDFDELYTVWFGREGKVRKGVYRKNGCGYIGFVFGLKWGKGLDFYK